MSEVEWNKSHDLAKSLSNCFSIFLTFLSWYTKLNSSPDELEIINDSQTIRRLERSNRYDWNQAIVLAVKPIACNFGV